MSLKYILAFLKVIKHPRHDNTKTVSNFDIAILTINREVDVSIFYDLFCK